MNRKTAVLIGLVVLIIILLFFYINPPTILRLSGSEEVNFCGTVYQSERVLVDGVDIIKRIAEIGTEHPEYQICEEFSLNGLNYKVNNRISAKVSNVYQDTYGIETSGGIFLVNPKTNSIWQSSPYGETKIGNLHKKSE
ncbi:MAG: hypothetical protein HYT48_01520 [Candidatus Vogelbacteria bacterium]|nr:hypothetical protein [Candidatus Vogelbacteria bacterium]